MSEREVLKIFRYQASSTSNIFNFPIASEMLPGNITADNIINDPKVVSYPIIFYQGKEYQVFESDKGKYILDGNVRKYIKSSYIDKQISKDKNYYNSDDDIYTFYINPKNIEITENKAKTRLKTRAGWEYQFWGNEPTIITVQGVSGGTLWQDQNRSVKATSTQDSWAWHKISELRTIYLNDHDDRNISEKTLLGIYYAGRIFVGHLDSFTGPTEDAEQPNIFSYGFKFTVEFETINLNFTGISAFNSNGVYLNNTQFKNTDTIQKLQSYRSE